MISLFFLGPSYRRIFQEILCAEEVFFSVECSVNGPIQGRNVDDVLEEKGLQLLHDLRIESEEGEVVAGCPGSFKMSSIRGVLFLL